MLKKILDWLQNRPRRAILIIGFLVYGLSIFNGFVWDDQEQVVNNFAIRSLTNIPYFFTQSTFNTGGSAALSGMYYKPLMTVFFSLVYQVSHGAWGFHLVQIVVHLANSYLIYLVLQKFLKKEWATMGSLLFLVHPGNVESVVYISALQDVLFMFFGLLAFAFLLYRSNWFLITLFLALSLLGKETGVLFLLLILIYLLIYRKTELKQYLLILAVLVSGYFLLRYGIAGVGFNHNKLSPIMLASFDERLLTMPKVIFYYVRLLFFPFNLAISQHWVVRKISLTNFSLPLLVDVLLFLGLVLSNLKLRSRALLFFSLLLVIGLGMHSQIIALDLTVSERWLYFPLFAFLGVALILLELHRKQRQVIIFSLLVVIVIFGVRSFWRTLDWRDGLTLFTKDEPRAAGNFDFENNLGVYLYWDGKYKLAQEHYLKSTQIAPHWWTNWNNLGVTYARQGKLKLASKAYLTAIKNGDYYMAYENYANLLLQQKQNRKVKEFLEIQALPKFPYNQRLQAIYQYLNKQ